MRTVTTTAEMQRISDELRSGGKRIAVVPTMGFLHEGHLSLIRAAARAADAVIVTLFVNPTQFSPGEDYTKYPRDLPRDEKLASSAGADILFAPEPGEMYAEGHLTSVQVDSVTDVLEGRSRPGHFRGVATVVVKLFNITKPHVAVFGQKDAQQAVVVRRLIEDLDFPIELIVAPTVREPDGLAMSSRNAYLSAGERAQTTVLYRSLCAARERILGGERDCRRLREEMTAMITSQPSARVDYVSIAHPVALDEVSTLSAGDTVLISLAVKVGSTRLIDNITVTV
jgi:pantoate--beta-alanine ligase